MQLDGYGAHEEGNTLTFKQFQEYLTAEYPEYGLTIEEHFMPRMKDIIIDVFLSVRHKMNPNNRKNCFEVFGFDFLLDEDFRIWLIEVNTNPFLGVPNKDMKVLVPQMVDDAIKIAVDPVCKPKKKTENYDQNGFELIYREENQFTMTTAVNHRRAYNLDLCYPIPSLKPFIGKVKREFRKNSKVQPKPQAKKAVEFDPHASTVLESENP